MLLVECLRLKGVRHFSIWLGAKKLDSKIYFSVVKVATLNFEDSLDFSYVFKFCQVVQIFALWDAWIAFEM